MEKMKNLNTMKKTFILLTSIIVFLGCSLDANNPNNLLEEQLGVSAFTPMVNGLEGVTVRAYGNILAPYSVASDEMIWIGSRDAWQQLNFGNVDNINLLAERIAKLEKRIDELETKEYERDINEPRKN